MLEHFKSPHHRQALDGKVKYLQACTAIYLPISLTLCVVCKLFFK